MPTYEYRCQHCQHQLEMRQGMNDPALLNCPACANDTLERLISLSAVQFKGGGWYADNYAKKPPEANPETKSDTASEAKPEKSVEKTETKSTPAENKTTEVTKAPAVSPKNKPTKVAATSTTQGNS